MYYRWSSKQIHGFFDFLPSHPNQIDGKAAKQESEVIPQQIWILTSANLIHKVLLYLVSKHYTFLSNLKPRILQNNQLNHSKMFNCTYSYKLNDLLYLCVYLTKCNTWSPVQIVAFLSFCWNREVNIIGPHFFQFKLFRKKDIVFWFDCKGYNTATANNFWAS